MKTIRQWLADALTISAADLDFIDKHRRRALDFKCNSFEKALKCAFVWGDTPQGHIYWEDKLQAEEEAVNAIYDYSAE